MSRPHTKIRIGLLLLCLILVCVAMGRRPLTNILLSREYVRLGTVAVRVVPKVVRQSPAQAYTSSHDVLFTETFLCLHETVIAKRRSGILSPESASESRYPFPSEGVLEPDTLTAEKTIVLRQGIERGYAEVYLGDKHGSAEYRWLPTWYHIGRCALTNALLEVTVNGSVAVAGYDLVLDIASLLRSAPKFDRHVLLARDLEMRLFDEITKLPRQTHRAPVLQELTDQARVYRSLQNGAAALARDTMLTIVLARQAKAGVSLHTVSCLREVAEAFAFPSSKRSLGEDISYMASAIAEIEEQDDRARLINERIGLAYMFGELSTLQNRLDRLGQIGVTNEK